MSFGWSFGVFWMVNFRSSIGVLADVLGSVLDAAMYCFIVVCIDLGLVLGVLVVAGVLVILWPLVGEFWISVRFNIGVLVGRQSVTSRSREFVSFFDGIGTGIGKIWYRKKSRNRSRKYLVPKKVSESVSKKFGTEKSLGIGLGKF